MKFLEWYNEADMPTKQEDGTWVDLETGIAFNPAHFEAESNKIKTALSKNALDARGVAKAFGGKALTGTAKQKEWAEKIRASVLKSVAFEDATILCNNDLTKASKFWIENREKPSADFASFVREQRRLRDVFAKLERGTDEARAVAAEYNALTAAWGFN